MQHRKIFAVVVTVLLLHPACARIRGGVRPVTPYEQTLATNASIATVNNGIVDGVMAAERVGLLNVDQTNAVLEEQFRIAFLNKQLALILGAGADAARGRSDEVQSLIRQTRESAKRMIATGFLGVKNPNTQATIQSQVDSLLRLTGELLGQLSQAGVLK